MNFIIDNKKHLVQIQNQVEDQMLHNYYTHKPIIAK